MATLLNEVDPHMGICYVVFLSRKQEQAFLVPVLKLLKVYFFENLGFNTKCQAYIID